MNMQNKLRTVFVTTRWPICSQSHSSDRRTRVFPGADRFPQTHKFHTTPPKSTEFPEKFELMEKRTAGSCPPANPHS